MSAQSSRDLPLARATVDVSSYAVAVPRAHVLDRLRRRMLAGNAAAVRFAETLELETPAGFGDTHPVVLESWRVRTGAIMSLGVEQDVWARNIGSAWGAFASLAMPAAWRAVWAGAARGNTGLNAVSSELMRGAISGATLGARSAMAMTEAAQKRFARYAEVSVFVPYVRVAGVGATSFVAGMYTDSRFAQTIDRALGYGFGKQFGRIVHDEHGLRVDGHTGRRQLHTRAERIDADMPLDAPQHWALPLLGMSPAGALVTSRLVRTAAASGCGLSAELETHEGNRWLLPEPSYRVAPATRECIAGGRYVRDVTFELSAPRGLQ